MDNKEVIKNLIEIIDRYKLKGQEKEAVLKSIGILDWVGHGQKRAKEILKKKKERETKID